MGPFQDVNFGKPTQSNTNVMLGPNSGATSDAQSMHTGQIMELVEDFER